MNVVLQILKAGNLLLTIEPIALEVATKLKALFGGLDPGIEVNITNLVGEALDADQATLDLVAEWKKQHGLS